MSQQLSFDVEEKLNFNFDNYDWLVGNSDNLKMFFTEQLEKPISQNLKNNCLKRLRELEIK